ncbi:DUF6471 domain-containing protein [Paracoccus sp. SSK6]|uniref:DUF6471 domain-containing protein n=1 Tax=Paracoccus sp. SSK6 TaxID=3143131 RepID=UPI00321AFBA8
MLFRSPTGDQSAAQIEAFDDTWHWGDEAETAFQEVRRSDHTDAATMLEAMRSFLGTNDMMAVRLDDNEQNLRNKISWGKFTARFLLQCLNALEAKELGL